MQVTVQSFVRLVSAFGKTFTVKIVYAVAVYKLMLYHLWDKEFSCRRVVLEPAIIHEICLVVPIGDTVLFNRHSTVVKVITAVVYADTLYRVTHNCKGIHPHISGCA